MVEMQNRRREIDPQVVQFPNHGTGSRRRDVRDLELPPLPLVLYVLRKVKGNFNLTSKLRNETHCEE